MSVMVPIVVLMEDFSITQPQHPVVRAVTEMRSALDQADGVDPRWLPVSDKQAIMVALQAEISRAEGLLLALLSGSEDVAEEVGARRVSTWWANQVNLDHGPALRDQHLAEALAAQWTLTATALRAGRLSVEHARVIARAMDDLPRHELPTAVMTKAEEFLVDHATHHTPKELRRIGDHLLEVIAPDLADAAEREKLERELQKAKATTRLSFRNRGDGSTDLLARIPDSVASRLRTYLDAHTSPRTTDGKVAGEPLTDPATGERVPIDRLRGQAFCAMLEHLDPATLPVHGGSPTTVVVTMDYETLLTGLGVGTLDDGTEIPAGEARRLACTAAIIPAVLGSKSLVLDLGRTSRFYTGHQRRAMAITHPFCRAEGCSVPATMCEAHHPTPWSRGGRTDLADGRLLCSWHHHRAHDDRYLVNELTNGDIRFHRRR